MISHSYRRTTGEEPQPNDDGFILSFEIFVCSFLVVMVVLFIISILGLFLG